MFLALPEPKFSFFDLHIFIGLVHLFSIIDNTPKAFGFYSILFKYVVVIVIADAIVFYSMSEHIK